MVDQKLLNELPTPMTQIREKVEDFFISWNRIEKVPTFLRFITKVSLGCAILFPLFAILPLALGEITVNGESITWQEFYRRGEPLIELTNGLILLPIPYGVLGKKGWVRPFLVCFPLIQILSNGILAFLFNHAETLHIFRNFNSTKDVLWYVFHLSVWISLATWYLYYKKTVVDFFNGVNSDSESQ